MWQPSKPQPLDPILNRRIVDIEAFDVYLMIQQSMASSCRRGYRVKAHGHAGLSKLDLIVAAAS